MDEAVDPAQPLGGRSHCGEDLLLLGYIDLDEMRRSGLARQPLSQRLIAPAAVEAYDLGTLAYKGCDSRRTHARRRSRHDEALSLQFHLVLSGQ